MLIEENQFAALANVDEIPVGKLKHVEIDRNQIIVEIPNKPMLLPYHFPLAMPYLYQIQMRSSN
jgi:hypothetical protein